MNKIFKTTVIVLSLMFIFYLLLPDPDFPEPISDSIQSFEPADTETPLRRGYYTNVTRSEALDHYTSQLNRSGFLNLPIPTYRLNYPPEEAQTLIRDQARSTFLEEIVHPFRESFFINGYEPTEDKDLIRIGGRAWRQKIIVRQVPSNRFVRVVVAFTTLTITILLIKGWIYSLSVLVKNIRRFKLW